MDFRTGDVIVWRSTNYYDALGEHFHVLEGHHSGLVFKGKKFEEFSVCGPSPSQTYVTFLVDQIFPIEEAIGHIWHRPNGAALHHIHRTSGPDVPEELAYQVFTEHQKLDKRSFSYSIYIAIAAYFRLGEIAPPSGMDGKRWSVCSLLIGYCLKRMGLLQSNAITNNLLPMDFYHLTFYQREEYQRMTIFDKQTYTYDWLFAGLMSCLGQLELPKMHCPLIDQLLANYDYPRSGKGPAGQYLAAE